MESEKKKILVIEDNNETQLIIKVNLRDIYDVELVDNAEDALNLLKQNRYDLVLLDLNLNGEMNGRNILEQIRGDLNLNSLPVVVTTAYDLPEEEKDEIKKMANDYIEKPLEKESLLETIKRCLKASNSAAV